MFVVDVSGVEKMKTNNTIRQGSFPQCVIGLKTNFNDRDYTLRSHLTPIKLSLLQIVNNK